MNNEDMTPPRYGGGEEVLIVDMGGNSARGIRKRQTELGQRTEPVHGWG